MAEDFDATEAKVVLRAQMLALRAAIDAGHRDGAAALLSVFAPHIARLAEGGIVSGFWPIGSEIDLRPLMDALHGSGVPLALPVTVPERARGKGPSLRFRRWQPGDVLLSAPFGLKEPAADAETVAPRLMLVPLLAFDGAGNRLGYGKGHYDSAIAAHAAKGALVTVGVAFADQQVRHVPVEDHDAPLDFVLTERALLPLRPPAPPGED